MKNIFYILVIAALALTSCKDNSNDLSLSESSLEISTSITMNLPKAVLNTAAQKSPSSNTATALTNTTISLEKWNDASSTDVFSGAWESISSSITDANGIIAVEGLKLGNNSFRAEYVTVEAGAIPSDWTLITENLGYNDLTSYKHYVGITRGVVPAISGAAALMCNFIPKSDSKSALWGANIEQAKSFNISSLNITKDNSNPKKATLNGTIVMEMTPKNSIVDLKIKNESSNLFVGVMANGKFKVFAPGTDVTRVFLNTKDIVAGSNLKCTIYALEKKSVGQTDFSSLDKFNILNGTGSVLCNETVEGNKRYFVAKTESDPTDPTHPIDDDMKIITLTDRNFTALGSVLVMYHTILEAKPLTWGGWNW